MIEPDQTEFWRQRVEAVAGRHQRAMRMMGFEPRANTGTPRSQQHNNLDVKAGPGTGSAPMIQG
eukprot:2355279-Prorocentrum_lima.AAC.1